MHSARFSLLAAAGFVPAANALLDPEGEAAVGFVNSSWAGLTDEFTARIIVIPSPGVGAVALAGVASLGSRRRR